MTNEDVKQAALNRAQELKNQLQEIQNMQAQLKEADLRQMRPNQHEAPPAETEDVSTGEKLGKIILLALWVVNMTAIFREGGDCHYPLVLVTITQSMSLSTRTIFGQKNAAAAGVVLFLCLGYIIGILYWLTKVSQDSQGECPHYVYNVVIMNIVVNYIVLACITLLSIFGCCTVCYTLKNNDVVGPRQVAVAPNAAQPNANQPKIPNGIVPQGEAPSLV